MPDPSDFINLTDWLGLNADAGQQMSDTLAQDVQAHANNARTSLGNAQAAATASIPYGGSADLSTYGEYVNGQREAQEAAARAAQYGTAAGREAGLREKYGQASQYDAALTGNVQTPDVSDLQGKFDAARQSTTQYANDQRDRAARQQEQQQKMWATYQEQQAKKQADIAEQKRRKQLIDQYRDIITRDYHYHAQQGAAHGTDPSSWSDQEWYDEAKRWDDQQTNQSTSHGSPSTAF